jgi:ribosomal-protein-alanine N-acetyltransferase
MTVDRATARDAERISELARLGETTLDPLAELAREWARLWVARPSGPDAPASGFLLAWDAADEVHLIDLVVHPDERRKGIARALCAELFEHTRARRARCLLLEVRRSNRGALALYRALGLRAVGVRKGYYSSNGEDAIEMQLDFDPESGKALAGEDEIDLGATP